MGGSYSVVIGRHDLGSNGGDSVQVANDVVHPNYDESTDENDFALVFLKRPTTASVPLVNLNRDGSFPTAGATAYTMGWGDTIQADDKQKISDVLMVVDLEVITNEECSQAEGKIGGFSDSYADYIYPSMICTYTPGQDACQGDSGQLNFKDIEKPCI